jgi:hypothetical protein
MSSIFLNEGNRHLTIAASHAEYALEELKSTTFTSIANVTWNATYLAAQGLSALDNESVSINAAHIRPSDSSSPFNITVNVSWKDHLARSRNVTVATVITEP